MRGDGLRGHLELLLLAAVARRPGHGYGIAEHLRTVSSGEFDVPEGSIYPALYRLERRGLVKSTWSEDTGRRRRMYAITAKGRKELSQGQRAWADFARGVNAVLGTVG
ncbi:MAG TPA: PadR family transcriptional regulator [Acidimicrobiales bacterium]|nr:PadR family transcriptional regulator [Acidimicrobiales bacterium]